jgi:ribonuclease-3
VSKPDVLRRAQEAIGYEFRDPSLLEAALTHASLADHRLQSNERLEFLGDAVLGLVVSRELYVQFPDYLEGELTKIKSAVVSRKVCAQISDAMSLSDFLFLGKGMSGRAPLPSSLSAAVLEAIIGAVYLDGGMVEAEEFVLKLVRDSIREAAESEHQRNYKSQLQQHAQKVLSTTPLYDLLDEQGPDHSKCFEICVVIEGHRFPAAWGPSKKEAEQKAAYLALEELDLLSQRDLEENGSVENYGETEAEGPPEDEKDAATSRPS